VRLLSFSSPNLRSCLVGIERLQSLRSANCTAKRKGHFESCTCHVTLRCASYLWHIYDHIC